MNASIVASTASARETALQYAESILGTMREPLLAVDETLTVRLVNAAFCQTFGVSEPDAIGRRIVDLGDGQWNVPELVALLTAVVEQGASFQDYEFTHSFARAGRKTMLLNAHALKGRASAPLHALIVMQDVSDRRRMEDDLRVLHAQLEERVHRRTAELASANKELEAFAYSVSHDLRAPLRAIAGFSQALLEDCAEHLDDYGRGLLNRVRSASGQMSGLIDDLLDLSRLTRAEMHYEEVDLSSLARSIAAEIEHVDPDRDVRWEIQEGLTAPGDPALLRLALYNLMDNAFKYSRRQPVSVVRIGVREDGGVPAYVVADNGVGFDMTYAGKLFAPFQRLHSAHEFEGNGIGLATVSRIVRRHGGRVWAEAKPGEGARFYFTLHERS